MGTPQNIDACPGRPGRPGRRDRLAPLVHDLIAWDLVYRSDAGTFVLRDDIQERLADASTSLDQSSPRVFVGRPCEECGVVAVTRRVGNARICADCDRSSGMAHDPAPTALVASNGHDHTRTRTWWHRLTG